MTSVSPYQSSSRLLLDILLARSSNTVNVLLAAFGKFGVNLGVPCHNGIQKRRIEDVAITPLLSSSYYKNNSLSYRSGATIALTSKGPISYGLECCAVSKESLHISLPILHTIEREISLACRETGYRELHKALWPAQKLATCECPSKLPATFELPAGCGALMVRCDDDFDFCEENLVLCLTGGDSVARWRALIANHGGAMVLLRGNHCCLTCAMEQASKLPGKCHLIL